MANPHKFYLSHMNSKTGYRATWDPGKPLKIGQIGKLDSTGVFNIFSTLEKEGIPVEVSVDDSTIDMDYTSHDSVTITAKLSGNAPIAGSVFTEVDSGFNFSFKSEKSVVFQSAGNKTDQLVNLAVIKKQILEKYKAGNWERDWLVITELVRAGTATIIISNSSNGQLDLKASAGASTKNLKLTDVSLGLTVASERGSTLKYIAEQGLTPFYRVMGIMKPFLSGIDFDTKEDTEMDISEQNFEIQEFDERELE